MIDIKPTHLVWIKETLRRELPHCQVLAFGSRVQNRAKKFSDLDLALEAQEKIPWQKIEAIKDIFADSDLPIIIDILDLKSIDPSFRKIIQSSPTELIQEARPAS